MNRAARLKFVRKKLKLTQEKFAISMGLNRDSIASLELEKVKISTLHALALEYVHGVNKDWLLHGQGDCFVEPSNKETASPKKTEASNITIIEHQDLIKRFKNPERGLRWNERLIDIEDAGEELCDKVDNYLQGLHDAAMVLKEQPKKKQGPPVTKRRANEK